MSGHERFFKQKNILVTGGAGFLGSHLVDWLMKAGASVVVLDNFTTGSINNLSTWKGHPKFRLLKGGVTRLEDVTKATKNCDMVFHLAATPEVYLGNPNTHLKQNVMGTFNVLEAIRLNDIENLIFTSSSTVYGDAEKIPTPEDYGPLKPISVYGASKLAAEGLISAYSNNFKIHAVVFRIANAVGPRAQRGVVVDFIKKLQKNPKKLEVLGNGKQTKSYIWVEDCIRGILTGIERAYDLFDVYNLGSIDAIDVTKIANIVIEECGLKSTKIFYTGGVENGRGWIGDVRYMHLDISKLMFRGWKPKYTSEQAVRLAVRCLVK